jgi:tRNA A-37 threonylcarbamoyl transferase component Bud32/tetratricopeptide (TPR) repeat protein
MTAGQYIGGTLLCERYRLRERIGRGGMGEVWKALDESLGREVAVKCLKPTSPSLDPSVHRVLRERFRREARVAAALQHRGITVVHDFGESEGVLFLVMELLEGRNLRQLLGDNEGRPLPLPDITDIAVQIAAALAYTHARGIVHRDLKPANVMRLTDGDVKICDFGIARLGHDIGFTSRLTGTGVAMGTPHYMSPEQIGGEDEVDHRSDLYSLGCVLYEIATGAPPFDLDDTWAVLVGHRDTPPRPPREHRPDLPGELEQLVLDLLAKSPEDRPQSAADVAGRLKTLRDGGTRAEPGLPSWARRLELASGAPSVHGAGALASRHTAAVGLARLGRWSEAERSHRAVAEERERLLGAAHPDTLASRYELALCLSRGGRHAEALRAYEEVAAVRAKALGADHPDTLAARQEAAYALGRLGRHEEARQGYAAVLAARERRQGPDHPDTLHCRHNLAVTLGRLGRTQEAYALAGQVAEARTRVLGPAHADTLTTRCEAGHLLGLLGRWPEARATYAHVAATRTGLLGADHPDTLAARHELGICLGRMGLGAEAHELYTDLVALRTRVSGPAHPDTLRARHGLGVNLGRLGRWREALAEARDVAAVRTRVLGADHPDTLVSRREIAVALGWLGDWREALTLHGAVEETRERVLGPDHPDTAASREDCARCREHLGLPGRPGGG